GCVARAVLPAAGVTDDHPPGEKLLVVDDEPLVLQFVRVALEQAGYRVHAVGGAAEALAAHEASATDPFRLLLSDIVMPHVSGVELARRLLSRDAGVGVLFMTGHAAGDGVPSEIA